MSVKPQRIRLERRKHFRLAEMSLALNGLGAVLVARPSRWGNPFVVGKDGTAEDCVRLYRGLMGGQCHLNPRVPLAAQLGVFHYAESHLKELCGKNLACWCALDAPCHADVLLDLANPVTQGWLARAINATRAALLVPVALSFGGFIVALRWSIEWLTGGKREGEG